MYILNLINFGNHMSPFGDPKKAVTWEGGGGSGRDGWHFTCQNLEMAMLHFTQDCPFHVV